MQQLGARDAAFLYTDTGNANANVTLIHVYDPSTAPGGRVRFKHILAHIESRLHRSAVFRRRLLHVPLELDYPYWVEDEHFDIEYHVRHIALPAPGDWRQFCIQASRIHARPLDLSRPLWEIHVIEGLDGLLGLPRGSFALLTKIHHAAIDLEAGPELTMLLHDLEAVPPAPPPPQPWFPEPTPGPLSLLARSMVRNALSPMRLARPLGALATRLAPAAASLLAEVLLHPDAMPVTRFNAVVSPHRVFETRRFPLAEIRRLRALVRGVTLDDLVMAVCAGGLRRYLALTDELPEASLVAIAPARVTDHGPAGAHLALVRTSIGTHLADPLERLKYLRRQARDAARRLPSRELAEVASETPAPTLALSAKLLGGVATGAGRRAPLANCTIAHVPGPSVPLYLGGARMTYFSAIMPIHDGMGLVFAVTSYDGMLIVSPTACREQLPDPAFFAQCVRDSFQEYLALADAATAAAKAPAKPARRRVRSAPTKASAAGTAAPAAPADRTAASPPRAARAARRRSTAPAR